MKTKKAYEKPRLKRLGLVVEAACGKFHQSTPPPDIPDKVLEVGDDFPFL